MDYLYELELLLKNMTKYSLASHKERRSLPKGKLYIEKRGPYYSYQQRVTVNGESMRRGIGKRPRLIRSLARKAYLDVELQRLDSDIACLKAVIQ